MAALLLMSSRRVSAMCVGLAAGGRGVSRRAACETHARLVELFHWFSMKAAGKSSVP